jgi:hypothetical protein
MQPQHELVGILTKVLVTAVEILLRKIVLPLDRQFPRRETEHPPCAN